MKKLYNRNKELEEICTSKDQENEQLKKKIVDLEKEESERGNEFDTYRFSLDNKFTRKES